MMTKSKYTHRSPIIVSFLIILILLVFLHAPILNYIAGALVYKDDIKPSDAIVVLVGDRTGERLMTAIDLFKRGYAGKIVFWGGPIYWKIPYAELYLRQMKESGIKSELAVWSEESLSEFSTEGEALVDIRLLREMGAKSFILVTSHYHTARAKTVFAPLANKNGMTMYVYPSEDSTVSIQNWWKDRESAKNILLEIQKTIWYKLFHNFRKEYD